MRFLIDSFAVEEREKNEERSVWFGLFVIPFVDSTKKKEE